MCDLLLSDREQAAVRAVIAAEQVRDLGLPGEAALEPLARLIDCDALGVALLDIAGAAVQMREVHRHGHARALPDVVGPELGVHVREHPGAGTASRRSRGVAVLSFGVRNGPRYVVALWLVRRASSFSDRDRDLLVLVAPALERLMRARISLQSGSALTAQERRVLGELASGLSNAEIAEHLCVAPCTVRKHLENAYRKMGVTNRLAAVRALEAAPV